MSENGVKDKPTRVLWSFELGRYYCTNCHAVFGRVYSEVASIDRCPECGEQFYDGPMTLAERRMEAYR